MEAGRIAGEFGIDFRRDIPGATAESPAQRDLDAGRNGVVIRDPIFLAREGGHGPVDIVQAIGAIMLLDDEARIARRHVLGDAPRASPGPSRCAAAADSCAALPGLDGLFLGLLTLQLSERLHGKARRAILHGALAAAKARGKRVDMSDPDPGQDHPWAEGAADLPMISNGLGALADGLESWLAAFRRSMAGPGLGLPAPGAISSDGITPVSSAPPPDQEPLT